MNQSPSQALEHLSNTVAKHGHVPVWLHPSVASDIIKHYGGDGTAIAHPGTEQHFAMGGEVGPVPTIGPITPGDSGYPSLPTPIPPGQFPGQIPPHKMHPFPVIGGDPKMPPYGGGKPPMNPGQPPYTGGNPPMHPILPPKPGMPPQVTEPPMKMPPGNLTPGPLHFRSGGSVSANINKGDLAQAGWTPPATLPGTTPGTTPNPGDGQAWQFANGGHGAGGRGSAEFPGGTAVSDPQGMGGWGGGAFPGGPVTGWGTGNGQTATPTYWGPSNGQSAGAGNGWYVSDGRGGFSPVGGGEGGGGGASYGSSLGGWGGATSEFGAGGPGSIIWGASAPRIGYSQGGQVPGEALESAPDTVPAMVKPGEVILNENEQKGVQLKKDWKKGLTPGEIKKVEQMRLKKKK